MQHATIGDFMFRQRYVTSLISTFSETLSLIANHKSSEAYCCTASRSQIVLQTAYTTLIIPILCMHCCCFTQGERKAFRTTPAENIYASLSEVRQMIMSSFIFS